ncbi:hypothetical protein [Clostridium sp.]
MFKSWEKIQEEQLIQYKLDLQLLTDADEIEMLENIISDMEYELNNKSNY